jgi:poly(A) polymerase
METMSFHRNESQGKNRTLTDGVLAPISGKLLQTMAALADHWQMPLYFSGGVVRDWLLDRQPADLDLTVASGALDFARELAAGLGAAFVPLSPEEGVARVVWGDTCLDISQFRDGTTTIEADLALRDFTVNAMAVGFDSSRQSLANNGLIIDPLAGMGDFNRGLIRLTHLRALEADPLRMLRAYRFAAAFDWRIEVDTRNAIARHGALIRRVSGERIAAEFDKILCCRNAHPTIKEMAECGLLFHLFPELGAGVGLLQPSSHHLDVFGHSLETFSQMESIIQKPEAFFSGPSSTELSPELVHDLAHYLNCPRQAIRLKYAALFHDLGKTVTSAVKEGRVTFYNHDEAGVALVAGIAKRLHWSNEDTRRISQLVRQHMWPFHLYNARTRTGITPKAILRLVKAAEDELIGLFFLVMADSLAGQGIGKPAGMEEGVAALFAEVYQTYQERLKPILEKPLVTGDDLIEELHLRPGPLFREIFNGLLEERAVNPEMTKAEALAWAKGYAATRAAEG